MDSDVTFIGTPIESQTVLPGPGLVTESLPQYRLFKRKTGEVVLQRAVRIHRAISTDNPYGYYYVEYVDIPTVEES